MQDRQRIVEIKQMLKLLQQINQLQIQNEETEKQNNKDQNQNDDEIINDIEIILNLDEDSTEQAEKDDKLSENETISNEQQQQQIIKQSLIEQRKAACRVVFNSKNNSYGCSKCQITYKVLKNLLNHQYRFHNRTKKSKNNMQKSIP